MKEVDVTHGSENEAGVKEAKCLKHAFFLLASRGGGDSTGCKSPTVCKLMKKLP